MKNQKEEITETA